MTRLLAVLVVLSGLAACSYERETTRAYNAPIVDGRAVTTPGMVAPSTKDTFQGVGRPL